MADVSCTFFVYHRDSPGERSRLTARFGAGGVLLARGHRLGGHSLSIEDRRLHYVYNWLGEDLQNVSSDAEITTGRRVLSAGFTKTGRDPLTKSALGRLILFIDTEKIGQIEIKTQPGSFTIAGEGPCVGRDSGSPVSPEYQSPFAFVGGTIDRVVVDVSGAPYVDHEKEVLRWILRDWMPPARGRVLIWRCGETPVSTCITRPWR